MKNWGHSLALLGTWMLVPLGCSTADNVDLGSTKGSALVDYAASWDGYAEAYKFDKTTSDRIRITLDANGDGTLEVGEQALFPPPTDFDVGYPAGDEVSPFSSAVGRLRPGFRYPLHGTHIDAGRLRLQVELSDPFATWCEHQTPYNVLDFASSGAHYACIPPGTGQVNPDSCQVAADGMPIPIDCGKLDLCSSWVCACTASGCTGAHENEFQRVQFDGALESAGASMVGTLVVPSGHGNTGDVPLRATVRLTRN